MSTPTLKHKDKRGRKALFHTCRTVSFLMDGEKADKAQKVAWNNNIPFSMWMRQAAEEKLQREGKARAAK